MVGMAEVRLSSQARTECGRMPVGRRGIGGNSTDSDGEYMHVWEVAETRDVTNTSNPRFIRFTKENC